MSGEKPLGFLLEGHHGVSGNGEYDMLCAAVSSAAFLTANTVTEICGCAAEPETADGYMSLRVSPEEADKCRDALLGLRLHLRALSEEYPDGIAVSDESL